jgi:hypothetical protein
MVLNILNKGQISSIFCGFLSFYQNLANIIPPGGQQMPANRLSARFLLSCWQRGA